ncbi:leucine-rich repeat domain-containing protein [Spirosoma fluviale]|nr:leucine-rich repeat domain-containing protein [Spirosoma fluviale]
MEYDSYLDKLKIWNTISNEYKSDLALSDQLNSLIHERFEGERNYEDDYIDFIDNFFLEYYFSIRFEQTRKYDNDLVSRRKLLFDTYFYTAPAHFNGGDLISSTYANDKQSQESYPKSNHSFQWAHTLPFIITNTGGSLLIFKSLRWLILKFSRFEPEELKAHSKTLIGLVIHQYAPDASDLEELIELKYLDISMGNWCSGETNEFGDEVIDMGITDLSCLSSLQKLEYLNLSSNYFLSNLTPLYGLYNLKVIDLRYCKDVDDREIMQLRRELPNCEVLFRRPNYFY